MRLANGYIMSALVAALVAAACGGSVQPSASSVTAAPAATAAQATVAPTATPAPVADIAVGMTTGLANAPVAVAQARGYFKEQNLNLSIKVMQSAADMAAALSGGQVQFTVQGFAAANFNAAARGIEQWAIASQNNIGKSYWPLVSRKAAYDDGSIRKVADLKGKKVSVNGLGGSTEYFLNAALKTGGLTVNDVSLTVIPSFPNAVTALGTGAIDAAMLIEPNGAKAVSTGVGHRLADDYLPNATISFVFTDGGWAQKNKDVVVRFLKAYVKGMNAVKNDAWKQGDLLQTLVTFTKMPEKDLLAVPSPFWTDGTIDLDDIANSQKFFMSRGSLTYTELVPVTKIVNATFLAEARK